MVKTVIPWGTCLVVLKPGALLLMSAVLVGMKLASFSRVVASVLGVPMRYVGVVTGLFVISTLVVFGSLTMVFCRVLVNWQIHGAFWLNFILGAACGLSIAIMVVSWQKQLHWIDGKIYPRPTELGLHDPHRST